MADGPVAEVLLRQLAAADGGLDSAELAAKLGVEHQAVVGAVKSLQALGEVSRARDVWCSRFGARSLLVWKALVLDEPFRSPSWGAQAGRRPRSVRSKCPLRDKEALGGWARW